ncbi:MAG TPA: DUF134 domain-containing protein [Syntrophomonadaceae bacterium]|nr:DUF134 domain-containing protein [Syntrophomonadaceae bacterium]
MARIPRCRRVETYPTITSFKPAGMPRSCLERIGLLVEELEAIRLKDHLGLEQEECAQKMQVSRPTFQRILMEARSKIADALINGKELQIEGGDYCLGTGPCRRQARRAERSISCPYAHEPGDGFEEENGGEVTMSNKIAICSTGDQPSSILDGRFGRCSYFLIWDPQTGKYESLANKGSQMNQGAGTGVAQDLLNKGVKTIIASRIGPKAFAVLKRAGAAIYTCGEDLDAANALKIFQDGGLELLKEANN